MDKTSTFKRWAKDVYDDLDRGLLSLIKAADVLTVHMVAQMRATDFPKDLIDSILDENNVSGFMLLSDSYGKGELKKLEQSGNLQRIGEQIVLATYTALEIYLIEKFKEYYAYKAQSLPIPLVKATLEQFSLRSLDEIKRQYLKIHDIHLPSFDCDYHIDPQSQFKPETSWGALRLLSDARNQIAHKGQSAIYSVRNPLDAWYPFEFARTWIGLFDANFDILIYEGRSTSLITEYKERRLKTGD